MIVYVVYVILIINESILIYVIRRNVFGLGGLTRKVRLGCTPGDSTSVFYSGVGVKNLEEVCDYSKCVYYTCTH